MEAIKDAVMDSKVYHVKVPNHYWVKKYPDWKSYTQYERERRLALEVKFYKHILNAGVIMTHYTEPDFQVYYKKSLLIRLLFMIRTILSKYPSTGVHIIKIK